MVILTDCASDIIDEGCIKVASSLAKKLKKELGAVVISYGEKTEIADKTVYANKFFNNKELLCELKKTTGPIIYIPFSSNSRGAIFRTFILAKKIRRKIYPLFTLRHRMTKKLAFLLKKARATPIVISKESYDFFGICGIETIYLKTGIDCSKFIPCSGEEKEKKRAKYGYTLEDKIVLHVGHLKEGRNVDKLLNIPDDYCVILVISSVTEKDEILEMRLRERKNIKIIDEYIPNIEEIYQIADVYLFPVQEKQNCIDIPLSVLEAISCNIPVVCTNYGELNEFKGQNGFCFIDDFSQSSIENAIKDSLICDCKNIRESAIPYDWNNAIGVFSELG